MTTSTSTAAATPFVRERVRPERRLVRFIVAYDMLVLALAAALAAVFTAGPHSRVWHAAAWWAGTVAAALLAFTFERLYERDRQQISVSALDEARDFGSTLSFLCFVELLAFHVLGFQPVTTATVGIFWIAALVGLPVARSVFRHALVPLLNTPQNTLVIGAGRVGQIMALKLRKHPEYNLRLVGFLDNEPHPLDPGLDDMPVLGREDDLVEAIRRYRVSRVILAFSKQSPDAVLELIREAGLREVTLSIIPRYFEIMTGNAGIADVDGIPVIELPSARLSRFARATKRAFDLGLTVTGLVAISPLLLAIAAAIRLDSRGPVFFRQPRRGREGRVFHIIKFRTMVVGAETMREGLLDANESSGPLFKIRDDPRVTRVGRLLRRTSLDELPQLLNVLAGHMSLVGPRPFVVYEDDRIDGWARRRLDLTPGITGPWQVLGRNEIGFDEMIRLDYLYVTNWSLWWDIKLLARTVPVVLRLGGY
jgi:exopolysaccharide biosynthesis polyprenyl glycosylphosphotransferase